MLDLGGVPSEERFRKLTEAQWALLMYKHSAMKMEKYDQQLSMIEYLAQLVTTMSPKAVGEIINGRRKKMEQMSKEETGVDKNLLAENDKEIVRNYSIDGEIVNTSFDDAIRDAVGDDGKASAALRAIMGDGYSEKAVVYTVDRDSIEYLKNHDDLAAKMQKILEQGNQTPLKEQSSQLREEEIAALRALEFDTISF